ncbi:ABC transporter permease [Aquimarina sp. ERC-38]|uniref:ABC transporter permease n=1 Tax=Aquimarina sp. ERC-38 TaxID=2949996 RepID=UPI002247C4ED|nr:FtsX-like permease family protein [Aquimarina sp. ERC-38]UZO79385.1 ABC transporter permease [Aquimarina sp. ERC-38]
MNFEYFIAKRLIKGKEHKSSISSTIIRIAIFAIAVGTIMMLITIATGIGLQRKIREKVSAFNGHVSITSFDNNQSAESLKPILLQQPFYPVFKEVEGIANSYPYANKAGVIRTATDFEGIVIKGVDTSYNWQYFEPYLIEGRLPDFSKAKNSETLISNYTANRMGFSLGDKVNVFFLKKGSKTSANIRVFTIVGIFDSGLREFDETYIFADIEHIRRMNKWKENEVGGFEIFLENFDEIESKGLEIYQNIPSNLEAETITYKYANIFEWLKLFDLNIFGIISIIIIVAGINIITALLVLILERTPMIGILKAAGASDWSIRKIFLYNAGYLILVGLFWGNLLGMTLLLLQKYFGIISLNPETYHVDTAPVHIDLFLIFLLNLGTMVLCLLMLLIPSYIISKIAPSKAIKFD